jgi:Tfp pilus assembly protein PilX
MNSQNFQDRRGVALILTLTILAVVLILLMAFITSMRTERMIAKSYNDLTKAKMLADGAVDEAVATIANATQPISPTYTYVTAPGVIYTQSGGPSAAWNTTALFTPGTEVDINSDVSITGQGLTYPVNASKLLVGWSDKQVNGALIGRIAYWVDDESSKVNLNVAQSRGNDLSGATPAAIDLSALENFSSTDQANVTNYVGKVRPLDTVSEIKLTRPPLTDAYAPTVSPVTFSNNLFNITVNSSSPNLMPWGDKRLNIVDVANSATLSTAQKVAAISNVLVHTSLTAWYGGNFLDKYPGSIGQIAANIIDYIDTDSIPSDSGSQSDTTPPDYLGLETTPYINELEYSNSFVLVTDNTATPPVRYVKLTPNTRCEFWNMYTNSNWNPGTGCEIVLIDRPGVTVTPAANVNGASSYTPPLATIPVNAGVNAGACAAVPPAGPLVEPTVSFEIKDFPVTLNFASGVVTGILRDATGRIDYQIMPVNSGSFTIQKLNDPVDGTYFRTANSAANDPRARWAADNWNALNNGVGSIGQLNGINRQVVTGVIRADGDPSCHIISGSRDRGTMSPSELSYIHTGYPWRTFWLQPQFAAESGTIPDWAVLDLFTATNVANIVGRININATTTNADVTVFPDRTIPLLALLTNSLPQTPANPNANTYDKGLAVTNIYTYGFAPASQALAPPATFCQKAFTMIGEIANVQSLSNVSPIDGTHSKRNRETPVRGIANIITTRSNTFTIWAIAQSIKKVDTTNPSAFVDGTDLVTGEVKVQAIVERYEDPPGTVKFRTKYYRYIYE